MSNTSVGADGEMLVCAFVEKQGMHVIERNWRCGHEEADIIARDGDTLCFIEVKTRATAAHGLPQEAVTRTKQRAIARVALGYIKTKRLFDCRVRFDVAAVLGGEINYIKNAFDTTGFFR